MRTTALAPTCAPSPMCTGPMNFAPVPIRTLGSIRGPLKSPSFNPIVTQGRTVTYAIDLDHTIDDHLAMRQVQTRTDRHRIADAHLRDRHGEAMRDPRENRYAGRLQTGLGSIEDLGQERVAHERQADGLADGIPAPGERVALGAIGSGEHARPRAPPRRSEDACAALDACGPSATRSRRAARARRARRSKAFATCWRPNVRPYVTRPLL